MLRQVRTENGLVRGIEAADPRITAFKGIPFAAPPVGRNRWRAPKPCENWAGEHGCTEFASDCELTNTTSLNFHLRLGFQEENRIICFKKMI